MSKGKLLAICVVWVVLFGIGAIAWRFLVQPEVDAEIAKKEKIRLQVGSSESRYDHRLNLALDSFSGYAVLRSEAFRKELGKKSIKVDLSDDGADYTQRLKRLQSGDVQMAAFTIDALIKASAELGDLPASIVAIIDETSGADAIVGYRDRFPSVDSFNDPNVRFVLTPNSPSETLARVVIAHFDLPQLPDDPFVAAKDAKEVFERYQAASPESNLVYVLWEPYVSKMTTQNDQLDIIVSSERFIGYIVDVLVVSRDYLGKQPAVVRDVIESYFRAAYQYQGSMTKLVMQDAEEAGDPLTSSQAESLVNGIQWKNTQRNYQHFGIRANESVQHIEDMIDNITRVLEGTGAIQSDPTQRRPNRLYYDVLLTELEQAEFHPGTAVDGSSEESVQLQPLTDRQWESLAPVGTLKVPRLFFGTGSPNLRQRDRDTLDELAKTLRTSQYYVLIRGNATREGDLDRNRKLAADRAQAAADYLIQQGVGAQRIRTIGAEPSNVRSVTFMLGQLPY